RTFHRNAYTLHDSAGGPAAGLGEPPAPEAPRRPATTHQEAVARQKQPGWDEPEETLQARPVPSRRARTEMQQCNMQCGCSWGRCLCPFAATNLKQRDMSG